MSDINRKRVSNIFRNYSSNGKEYIMELNLNYSFDNSGSDRYVGKSINDIYEETKHIVFCNGE